MTAVDQSKRAVVAVFHPGEMGAAVGRCLTDAGNTVLWASVRKGWRWVAEMEEIAATMTAAGLPDGFHRAAAEIFRRSPRAEPANRAEAISDVAAALTGSRRQQPASLSDK
jgi:predicted dinucleotide-binding enzyme